MGFIDNFFSKKNRTLNKSPERQILEVPENWNFYMCQIDEQPASYFLNLALAEIAPITERSTLVWIEIQMNHSREDGLSSSEEFDHLAEIEDQIIPALTNQHPILYIGRLTHNHLRTFYFYGHDEIDVDHTIHQIMQMYPDYNYQLGKKSDLDWSTYFNYMYPDKGIMQTISNRAVIENLLSHGDSLEVARPVDHWIYFQNEDDCTKFLNIVKSLGFEIVNQTNLADREHYPFQLQISRIDHVDLQSIDACTLQLWKLAQQYSGEYDGWETQIIKN
ncbi:DUF695 domain-containing protein [Acinetobacter haemolyticus]|uniref:DUF695 domain-containing protein n=1 Tax=Acinetobacter haemolyticus TaxID=29430 RepID=UPI00325A7A47